MINTSDIQEVIRISGTLYHKLWLKNKYDDKRYSVLLLLMKLVLATMCQNWDKDMCVNVSIYTHIFIHIISLNIFKYNTK